MLGLTARQAASCSVSIAESLRKIKPQRQPELFGLSRVSGAFARNRKPSCSMYLRLMVLWSNVPSFTTSTASFISITASQQRQENAGLPTAAFILLFASSVLQLQMHSRERLLAKSSGLVRVQRLHIWKTATDNPGCCFLLSWSQRKFNTMRHSQRVLDEC